ncbi:2OG-Fe dioxygenase family protein [Azohydromonas aeria]|uniref:2OG-Fe dioxygenase family protein n=1 Tax=Azohydromonas aeria TaxID=2590212 RepID=UPI0012F8FE54|nr:2OG-Fe dioxygenase family protein [Azohydromonas aeria]
MLAPPFTDPARLDDVLRSQGHAVLSPQALQSLLDAAPGALSAWRPFWDRLPPDAYLRDGGRYRRRRHANYVVTGERVQPVPHRAHWQPVDYNALHGGIERWFEPVEPALEAHPLWQPLLRLLARRADALRGAQPWYVEAHAFRIDTTDGIGRPTPEGAHRDGVDLVAVLLLQRQGVKGGESRVFDVHGPQGLRFTMSEPGTLLLLDDTRVIHETTPIQPDGEAGWRDTLVVTLRRGGFQGPEDPLHE